MYRLFSGCSLQRETKWIVFFAMHLSLVGLSSILIVIEYAFWMSSNVSENVRISIASIGIILIASTIVSLILLLAAAFKRCEHKFLLPWLIIYGVSSITRTTTFLVGGGYLIGVNGEVVEGIAIIGICLLMAALDFYLLSMVHSCYRVLAGCDKNQNQDTTDFNKNKFKNSDIFTKSIAIQAASLNQHSTAQSLECYLGC